MIKDAKGATTVRNTPGSNPYTGGTAIEVTQDKVINLILREENNLLNVNNNNELYCDLQLANGLKPTDTIPVGRTVGRVLASDGWIKTGTLVCEKTTSGDIVQILYADDGTIWINRGSGWVQLRDRYSLFVTQAEYNALSDSKLTDGNCYIIVDNHNVLLSFEQLIALSTYSDIETELNLYPTEYFTKYTSEGHIYNNQLSEDGESVYHTNGSYGYYFQYSNGTWTAYYNGGGGEQ